MAPITYLEGDATAPAGPGPCVIAHVCNDAGGWGQGFVLALSRRWRGPEASYRKWAASPIPLALGMVQMVPVGPDLFVANLVAQHGYASPARPVALDYEALSMCLTKLAGRAVELGASVHMPRIGCGLAGGNWDQVAAAIEASVCTAGVDVFVYDLAAKRTSSRPASRRRVTKGASA